MAVKSNLNNMVLALGMSCLFCSAMLGGAYALTKEPIEKAQAEKTKNAISQVLPHFETLEFEDDHHYYTAFDGDKVGPCHRIQCNGLRWKHQPDGGHYPGRCGVQHFRAVPQ